VLCGGKCVDPLFDPQHCGAALGGKCSSTTASSPDFQGVLCPSGQACVSGLCAASCGGTLVPCNGCCVDTQNDPAHCSACNKPCPKIGALSPACVAGVCSYAYKCGDGVMTIGEECDGADFGGETCVKRGFLGGVLACSATCTRDTSACWLCTPGDKRCNGLTPQTCSAAGRWQDGPACAHTCSGGTCAALLADSSADFSCIQGKGNWYYGYSLNGYSKAGFTQLGYCDGSHWFIANGVPYPHCSGGSAHPTAVASNGALRWVVRRWVSTVAGAILISGHIAKYNTSGGDGVTGYVFVDGVQKWSQKIVYNDAVGKDYSISTTVAVGSLVDFVVSPDSGDYADGVYFTSVIEH